MAATTTPGAHDLVAVDYTATCARPRWDDLPPGVRQAVAQAAGARVVAADDPPGSGFTGGFAAVVHLDDGRSVFAKAGSSRNPHLTQAYAQEARVLRALPEGVPAPAFVGEAHLAAGEVDEHEWRVVVAERADGALPQPWTPDALEAVHAACLRSVAALTPEPAEMELPTLGSLFVEDDAVLSVFRRLASGELVLTHGQPAWLPERYAELDAMLQGAGPHLAGDTACHCDLRADNILLGPGGATFVDWNWLVRGAAWVDFVGLLPLARADGVDVDTWVARSPLTRDVAPEALDAWLTVIAAYMLRNADEPVWVGGPPAVRDHQRRYARTYLDWLGARRCWV
ncbi:MAG: phosphotransferase [Angustibacter sp.]